MNRKGMVRRRAMHILVYTTAGAVLKSLGCSTVLRSKSHLRFVEVVESAKENLVIDALVVGDVTARGR